MRVNRDRFVTVCTWGAITAGFLAKGGVLPMSLARIIFVLGILGLTGAYVYAVRHRQAD